MKEIITCVKESFNSLSNPAVKGGISIISPSQIDKENSLFVSVSKNLPSLKKIVKKSTNIAIVSSGKDIPTLKEKYLLGANYISAIGLQEYLIENEHIKELNLRYYETINLGELRDDFSRSEPLLRECEYVIIDMKSLQYSDYELSDNPNGFKAEEFNQLAHYIGCSLNLKGVIIYNLDKALSQSCYNMVAQMAWIISKSAINNIKEDPSQAYKKGDVASKFEHKIVEAANEGESIVFISSTESGRMWMEIPIVKKNKIALIPCSEYDFQEALSETISNKWLMYYSKYNIL